MTRPTAQCTADTIVAEVVIAAPQASVWAALTDGKLLGTWWGSADTYRASDWRIDLRVGGKWECQGIAVDGSTFSTNGEFVTISPIDRLVMTWNTSWDPTPTTTIDYELSRDGNNTRLRLTHSGFAGHETSRDGHAQGWVRVLGWLTEFVENEPAARSR